MPPAQLPLAQTQGVVPVTYQTVTRPNTLAVQNIQQMQTVLHDSLYPSQREWAAQSLATVDWRNNPQVVEALIRGAKDDPAATVRAACVHCLGKMHVNTVPVVNTVQGLKSDSDPRVRTAVEEALASLVPSSSHSSK
jgi:hypothetical protein